MILALRREEEKKPLKAVLEVLDQEPQLSQQQLRLVLWMCSRYFCTFYDALHTVLPIGLWYKYKEVWSGAGKPDCAAAGAIRTAAEWAAGADCLTGGPAAGIDFAAANGKTGACIGADTERTPDNG